MSDHRTPWILCLLLMLFGLPGCSPSADDANALADGSETLPPVPKDPWQGPDPDSDISPTQAPSSPTSTLGEPNDRLSDTEKSNDLARSNQESTAPIKQPIEGIVGGKATPDMSSPNASQDNIAGAVPAEGFPLAVVDPKGDSPGIGLRADFTPDQLVEFLATADKDMQTIVTGGGGFSDPEEARSTLIQIVKLKLEASRRLADNTDLTEKLRSEGQRGQLQSLSHLAALGNVESADQLKSLAKSNLESDNPDLVSDSRLVLIGFAIEDLQNGVKQAPENIVGMVRELAQDISQTDVPAMMAMGQARQLLASYGYDLEAREVRDTIIDLFANSPDANVAKMAATMAGNVRFDAIDKLVIQVTEGKQVQVPQWIDAAETLIDESADLQTVQYLSGVAVEFESRDKLALAGATYEVLQERFTEKDSASFKELQLALEAKEARESAIGRKFDFSLPSIDQTPLSMLDFRGKVVLMPFWSIDFPQSLQILPKLKMLADANPDTVAVVGMNLDSDYERVLRFVEKSGVDFPSFRAESSEVDGVANPAAAQFGVVSLPCVAIFDQEGRAAKVDFAGRQLDKVVGRLIKE